MVVLPCLPALVFFNVADDLGKKRILTRLVLFPAGAFVVFVMSVVAIAEFPVFFLSYSAYLDIVWGVLIVWLGFAILRRRGTFVIRAARENFRAWCVGTFMMGAVFGALWTNYLSKFDPSFLEIYNGIFTAAGPTTTLWSAAVYALGLCLTMALLGLVTFGVAAQAREILQHNRATVKLISGALILLVGAYLIYNDVYSILSLAGYL